MSGYDVEVYNDQYLAYQSGDTRRAGDMANWTPEQRLQGFELMMQGVQSLGTIASDVSNASVEIARCLRDIEVMSKELDNLLTYRLAEMDKSLAKFRESLPMVERLVDKQCDQIEAILHKVLAIDVEECSDAAARHRSELIALCGTKNRQLNEVLMKFLSM